MLTVKEREEKTFERHARVLLCITNKLTALLSGYDEHCSILESRVFIRRWDVQHTSERSIKQAERDEEEGIGHVVKESFSSSLLDVFSR
jgi:hypothetical protein